MKSRIALVALFLAFCAPALAIEPGVSGVKTKPGATVNSMKVIPPNMAAVGGKPTPKPIHAPGPAPAPAAIGGKTTTPTPAGGPATAPGLGR
ncbi:MAG: hypothetical protein WAK03_02155 [Methylocystis sp.]|jgi:hypothetical protein